MSTRFSITVIPKMLSESGIPSLPTGVNGWIEWINIIISCMVHDYINPNSSDRVNYTFTPCGDGYVVNVISHWHSAYISNLTDEVIEDVLMTVNSTVQSQLFNTLVNECGVDRGYLLRQTFIMSKRSKFTSTGDIPVWLLGLLTEVIDDLIGTTLESKLVVTHSMVVAWVRHTFKSVGIIKLTASMNINIDPYDIDTPELKSD